MPQLEPASFLPQLFWLALTFIPLYLIMAKVALPRVAEVREQRAVRIATDLEEAEDMKRKADEAKAAYETALAEARSKAQEALLTNRKTLQAETEARLAGVMASLAADAVKAEAAVQAAKVEALSSIRSVTAEVCRDLVARISGIELDEATVKKVVESKLAAINTAQGAA